MGKNAGAVLEANPLDDGTVAGAGGITPLTTQTNGQLAAFIEYPLIKEPGTAEEHKLQREARNSTDSIRKRLDTMRQGAAKLDVEIGHWSSTKQYRAMGYETFAEWCQSELGLTRQYGNRLINAERIRGYLPAAEAAGLNEGQARELSTLEPEAALAVIEKAKEIAKTAYEAKPPTGEAAKFDKGPKVTAKVLKIAREQLYGEAPEAEKPEVESETDNTDTERVYKIRFDSVTIDSVDKLLIHEGTVKIGKIFYRVRLEGGKARYAHIKDEMVGFLGIKPPKPATVPKSRVASDKPAPPSVVQSFDPDVDPEPPTE